MLVEDKPALWSYFRLKKKKKKPKKGAAAAADDNKEDAATDDGGKEDDAAQEGTRPEPSSRLAGPVGGGKGDKGESSWEVDQIVGVRLAENAPRAKSGECTLFACFTVGWSVCLLHVGGIAAWGAGWLCSRAMQARRVPPCSHKLRMRYVASSSPFFPGVSKNQLIRSIAPEERWLEFKVRWEGYDAADDSWEPAANLDACREKLATFLRRLRK